MMDMEWVDGLADPANRWKTLDIIGGERRSELAPWVANYLVDMKPEIRAKAARTLGQLESHASKEMLARLIGDTDAHVRLEALKALASLADPADKKLILPFCEDASVPVRDEALKTLKANEISAQKAS